MDATDRRRGLSRSPEKEHRMLGAAEIFTIFFVTLGPLKVLGPFAQRTRDLSAAMVQQVAVRAFLIATAAIVVGGFLGRTMLAKWQVTIPSMAIAAGIIFLLVALRQLLEQYEPPQAPGTSPAAAPPTAVPPSPISPTATALRLVFPIVLTPYGIAAVIVFLAASADTVRTLTIVALLVVVMILNLAAMLFARRILVGATMFVLQVIGAVLGVMQLALAVQFIVTGLQGLGVVAK